MKQQRFVCIHGHFYQPPRENPWLEAVEVQDSAHPYHDWNERITAECYAPNARSRVLDEEGRVAGIVNNYSGISFDIGPTLFNWMEAQAPQVYRSILEADRLNLRRFAGHGSALAQAYHHLILPLATFRQKRTQVLWGIRDFQHRFGRFPEGMWLPECAVDLPSLEILAELGVRFTILSPHQARRVRPIGESGWRDVHEHGFDTTTPYQVALPSGRSMVIFFYNRAVSRAVAFERLLNNGEDFARRLLECFADRSDRAQLVSIATDGETYGHHHPFGEMALSYALRHIESSHRARLTNYGEFLANFPPAWEVEIHENTSWSCPHGIERWRSHCGCGEGVGRTQQWRSPLRDALNWLEERVTAGFERVAADLLRDPWTAEDEYIDVLLDRTTESSAGFLERHAARPLGAHEQVRVWRLLELKRQSMAMFTSCGWFFDDLSRIEPLQLLRHAARAVQLALESWGEDLTPGFLQLLEKACSNEPEQGDGRRIYETHVKPEMAGLSNAAGHFALSSLFEKYGKRTKLYCYSVQAVHSRLHRAGKARMTVGELEITSDLTHEFGRFIYGAVYLGDHILTGGVMPLGESPAPEGWTASLERAFQCGDLLQVIRSFEQRFEGATFQLKQLFRDEQRKIMRLLLNNALAEVEATYEDVYEANLPLMRFVEDMRIPLPTGFEIAAQFVLNTRIRREMERDPLDAPHLMELLAEARLRRVELDSARLGFVLRQTTRRMAEQLSRHPEDAAVLDRAAEVVDVVRTVPFPVLLWDLENVFCDLVQEHYPTVRRKAERGDELARECQKRYQALGEKLKVRVRP